MAQPDRFASLDIGSNTVRLLIAERAGEGVSRPLRTERRITRLGGNFSLNGYLAEDSISRTVAAVKDFALLARKEGVKAFFAVATGVVREAKNRADFLARLKSEAGIEARLLAGPEEARLTLQGVLGSLKEAPSSHLVTDVGGWSTEILWIQEGRLQGSRSTNLGAVSASEKFLCSDPPQAAEVKLLDDHAKEALREIRRDFEQAGWASQRTSSLLIGTAGTITTLAAIDLGLKRYDARKIDGHRLSLNRLEGLYSRLAAMRAGERKEIPGLEEGREDLILPGTRIVLRIMEIFQLNDLLVIDSGLLEGVMAEGLGK